MLGVAKTKNELVQQAISNLYDLGFDQSPSSNIRKIIESIIDDSFVSELQNSINGLNFSSMEGDDLDYVFGELFGIKRFEQTSLDNQFQFSFIFKNEKNPSIFFEAGANLKYAGEEYIVGESRKIKPNDYQEIVNIICKKNVSNINYNKTITCGSVILNFNDKIYSSNSLPYEDLKEIFENDFVFVSQDEVINEKETDVEYRIRAKNIFQNFGYNNITIILNKIKSIPGVYEASYIEHDFSTEIFIMPKSLSVLNTVFETAKEICDYYKISDIVLRKPPVVSFSFEGILDQFEITHQEEIKNKINLYVKDIFNNDCVFNRDNFENLLYDYGNSKNSNFILKENNIKITYDVYSENDYIDKQNAEPVITKTIPVNSKKVFKNTLIVCGSVK